MNHRVDVNKIKTLNLMRFDSVRTFHDWQNSDNAFNQKTFFLKELKLINSLNSLKLVVNFEEYSHFLTYCRALLEKQIDVDVEIASSDAPSHSTHNFVERR